MKKILFVMLSFLVGTGAMAGEKDEYFTLNAGFLFNSTHDSAKAQADASKAQYDLAKLQVDYTEVRAPVDGTILIADQAVGGIGNQSQPVAVLADLTNHRDLFN